MSRTIDNFVLKKFPFNVQKYYWSTIWDIRGIQICILYGSNPLYLTYISIYICDCCLSFLHFCQYHSHIKHKMHVNFRNHLVQFNITIIKLSSFHSIHQIVEVHFDVKGGQLAKNHEEKVSFGFLPPKGKMQLRMHWTSFLSIELHMSCCSS